MRRNFQRILCTAQSLPESTASFILNGTNTRPAGPDEAEMKQKRWMKWIVEADAEAVELPWARGDRRRARKQAAKTRARAA